MIYYLFSLNFSLLLPELTHFITSYTVDESNRQAALLVQESESTPVATEVDNNYLITTQSVSMKLSFAAHVNVFYNVIGLFSFSDGAPKM